MDFLIQYHEAAAVLIARIFLGVLFLFQGFDAVFNVGTKKITESLRGSLEGKNIPRGLIAIGAWFTSYSELFCGLLLIIGLAKYFALYVLGINLLVAGVAFSILRPMWDMQFVFPRLVLILFLLVVPSVWDLFSLDSFFTLY